MKRGMTHVLSCLIASNHRVLRRSNRYLNPSDDRLLLSSASKHDSLALVKVLSHPTLVIHRPFAPTNMLIGLHLSSLLFYILFVGLPHAGEALVVQNASPVTLPIARRLNMTGAPNLVKLDQARAKALKEGIKHTESTRLASMTDVPVMNGVVSYVASVRTRPEN